MLGERIGQGRTAEVFGFGEGRAVKLLRPGFVSSALEIEADKTAAAVQAGAPAPAVLDHVVLEGRVGVVFERVDGPSMLEELVAGADVEEMATLGAELHCRLFDCHATRLPNVKDRLVDCIERAHSLTTHERSKSKERLAQLPEGDSVLHGDFHPGNIHLGPDGPVVIDWADAAKGSPAADVARTLLLVSPASLPPETPDQKRIITIGERFHRAYLQRIMRFSKLDEHELEAWALPVAAARLSEGITYQEQPLVALVRTHLQ